MSRSVVLTRRQDANAALARALASRGLRVVEVPCVEVEALADDGRLAAALAALGADDRLIVTSDAGARAVLAAGHAIRAPIATVGSRAGTLLRAAGCVVDLNAETAEALACAVPLPAGRVLLTRSDRALPELPRLLRERGAHVAEVVAYRTIARASGSVDQARADLGDAVVAFASPSAVDAFVDGVGTPRRAVALGASTAARLRARCAVDPVIAAAPTNDAFLAAILTAVEVAGVAHGS